MTNYHNGATTDHNDVTSWPERTTADHNDGEDDVKDKRTAKMTDTVRQIDGDVHGHS